MSYGITQSYLPPDRGSVSRPYPGRIGRYSIGSMCSNRKYVFCAMAPSFTVLEHVSRSNQEAIFRPPWKKTITPTKFMFAAAAATTNVTYDSSAVKTVTWLWQRFALSKCSVVFSFYHCITCRRLDALSASRTCCGSVAGALASAEMWRGSFSRTSLRYVRLLSWRFRLSCVCLSVMLVSPTQKAELFRNFCTTS